MRLAILHVTGSIKNARAGEKFARMDLIGLPYQLVVGPRGLENKEVEVKQRANDEKTLVPLGDITAWMTQRVSEALQVV